MLILSTLFARPNRQKDKTFFLTLLSDFFLYPLSVFNFCYLHFELLLCVERLFVSYNVNLYWFMHVCVCLSNCKCMLICLRNVSLQRLIKWKHLLSARLVQKSFLGQRILQIETRNNDKSKSKKNMKICKVHLTSLWHQWISEKLMPCLKR